MRGPADRRAGPRGGSILPWIGDESWTTGIIALGWGLLIAFALMNIHLTGMAIVAVGLSCNLLALVANSDAGP